jgi:hypothetical protein
MPDASGQPRRKRLSWECRCEIVAKVRLQGMRPELAATAPLADVLTPWPGLAERLAARFAGAGGRRQPPRAAPGRDITAVRVRPDRGPRPGARIRDDDERTRCQSSHRPPPRTPATPP